MSDMRKLRQLARDIIDNMDCNCIDADGNEPRPCQCGGEGRDIESNIGNPFEGCWNCQAKAALARRPSQKGRVK